MTEVYVKDSWDDSVTQEQLHEVVQARLLRIADLYSGGSLEHLEERVERIAGAIGRLIDALHLSGHLTLEDITAILQDRIVVLGHLPGTEQ